METNEIKQGAVMMIEVGMTRQPRAYQSIRVGVTLPVFVTPEDDVLTLLEDNLAAAKFALEEEIDQEFESYGEAAVYSKEPRYMLVLLREPKLGAIVPQMKAEKLPGGWPHARIEAPGHRLGYVQGEAASEWDAYTIIDASDGDLSRLPTIERCVLHTNSQMGMAVLVRDGIKFEEQKAYPGYWGTTYCLANPLKIVGEMIDRAKSNELTLFECIEGDFSNLPVPPKPEIEPEEADDDDDDNDDDDNDDDD